MDLQQLRCFVAAAELGSFNAAGLHLRLATSGLSRHISNLEKELGAPLFVRRSGGRALLSAEGERLLGDARRLVGAFDEFSLRARGSVGRARTFTVGTVTWMGSWLPALLLERVTQHRADIMLRLSQASMRELVSQVDNGDCDLAIVAGLTPEVEAVHRVEDQTLLVSREDMALAGPVTVADLATVLAIVPPTMSWERGLFEHTARDHGQVMSRGIEADIGLWPQVVRRIGAHMVLPSMALRGQDLDGLHAAVVEDWLFSWLLVRRRGAASTELEELVVDVIREATATP